MGVDNRFEITFSLLLTRNVGINLFHFWPIRNVQGGEPHDYHNPVEGYYWPMIEVPDLTQKMKVPVLASRLIP